MARRENGASASWHAIMRSMAINNQACAIMIDRTGNEQIMGMAGRQAGGQNDDKSEWYQNRVIAQNKSQNMALALLMKCQHQCELRQHAAKLRACCAAYRGALPRSTRAREIASNIGMVAAYRRHQAWHRACLMAARTYA